MNRSPCHRTPPTGLGHPNNTNCATCHATGYTYLTATTGTITAGALATHVDGAITVVAATTCTSCHGTTGRASGGIAGVTYDANQAAAPPNDTRGASASVLVGAHAAHVNPTPSVAGATQPTGGVFKPIACIECHPNNTTNSHGNGAINFTFAGATGANLNAFTPTFTQGNGTSTTVAHATVLHRVIAGSRLVIVEDAAHLANIEQPQAFNAALRAFLDEVDDALPAA